MAINREKVQYYQSKKRTLKIRLIVSFLAVVFIVLLAIIITAVVI